ncbi:MAG: dipicolinate synthase subunit DpsA [Bacillota bacterium]
MQDAADNSSRYLVIGGDNRSIELARIFKRKGSIVSTLGMINANIQEVKDYEDMDEALENSDILIGPIPFSKEKNIVNAEYADKPIEIERLFQRMNSSKLFLTGAMNKSSRDIADKHNIKYIDYYWDESYQVLNAIPTVEGALALLIKETDYTIHGSRIMVLGYGRIGKLLCDYLRMMGARVYAEARKDGDIAWIVSKGINPVYIDEISSYAGSMDIIINTVPALIIDKKLIDILNKEVLIVDLASMPGGVDFEHAKCKGIKAIHALGLPGKVAYKTAAQYMYETIMKLIAKNI